jgi:hypothetical protein
MRPTLPGLQACFKLDDARWRSLLDHRKRSMLDAAHHQNENAF